MEALILAAGRGSRMGELGGGLPKALLRVGDRPIIGHQLSLLFEQGIRKVTVVVGFEAQRTARSIQQVVPAGMQLNFVTNPFFGVTNTLGSFWLALSAISDDLVYMNGDTIFDRPVLHRLLDSTADIAMAVDDHPCGEEEMKVVIQDGAIIRVSKQVNPADADGEFIGVAKLSRPAVEAFSAAALKALDDCGPMSYAEAAFEVMAAEGHRLTPVDVTGLYWQEIDFEADLERARSEFPHSQIGMMCKSP